MNTLFYGAAGLVFLVGAWGIVTSKNLIHAVGCLSVVQSSTYLLLLAVGYRRDATAPVFSDVPTSTRVVMPRATPFSRASTGPGWRSPGTP